MNSRSKIDYGLENNWHHLPTVSKGDVDIFVIHPTVTFGYHFANINSPIYSIGYEKIFGKDIQLLLNPVNEAQQNYNVFIPKYQSAGIKLEEKASALGKNLTETLIKELKTTPAGHSLMDALDYFLNNYWHGKKWAIFGYSQGSILAAGTVVDYLAKYHKGNILDNLQHLYLAGFSPTQKIVDSWQNKIGFSFSKTPKDTHTISAWACACQEEAAQFNNNTAVNYQATTTTNPVTFTQDGESIHSDDLIDIKMKGVYHRLQNKIKYITKPGQGFTTIDFGDMKMSDIFSKLQIDYCHKNKLAVAHLLELQKLTIRNNLKTRLGLKGI